MIHGNDLFFFFFFPKAPQLGFGGKKFLFFLFRRHPIRQLRDQSHKYIRSQSHTTNPMNLQATLNKQKSVV